MSDIVTRLRRWTHDVNAAPASDLMDQAADEIQNLRTAIRRLAEQDATLSVCDGAVTVTMDGTLTDEERAAIQWFAHYGLPERYAAALRDLLERTK